MYYSEEIIEEVRIHNDIVDVVSEYVQLKKRGSSYFGLCPFHNEGTPSFSVSPDKQIYKCFGCGAAGNVFSFVMQIENYDFVEAVKYLADRAHIVLPEPEYSEEVRKQAQLREKLVSMHREAARYYYANLQSSRGQVGQKYLEDRKITREMQKSFGIGFASPTSNDLWKYLIHKGYEEKEIAESGLALPSKNGTGYKDRFWNRVMFPIFDVHSRIIGFGGRVIGQGEPKYLNSPETKIFTKSKNLYGLNFARISRNQQILVVEGYMDVISLFQAGFTSTVASLGTAFTPDHGRLLRKYAAEVVLIYDSDQAGTNAALRAIPILISVGLKVRVLQVPGEKDPDDFIKQNGKEAFQKLLHEARSHISFQVGCIREKYNIQDTEQKIQFTTEVAVVLSKLTNAIEQDAYVKEVSKDTNISEEAIQREIDKTAMQQNQKPIKIKNQTAKPTVAHIPAVHTGAGQVVQKGVQEAQKSLLHLIAANAHVYEKVKRHLLPGEFLDPFFQRLAERIYMQCEQKKYIHPAELASSFSELSEQKIITEIFTSHMEYESNQEMEKAVNDHVKMIKRYRIDVESRTSTDIQQIQKLIEEKRKLADLYIPIIDG